MQVTETLKDGLKRGYTITVTADELKEKVQAKLVEAQPEVEMKGFRKGKVPLPILKQRFGARIIGDAMQEAVDGAVQSHFLKAEERPALQPAITMVGGEEWKEGDDVIVEMTYEALPEIPDLDLSDVAVERLIVKADEPVINEALERLAAGSQSFKKRRKGSKAKEGDEIIFDFKGSIDGVEFDGGSAEDHALVLGSNAFIPGFEDQLVGAKEEDQIDVKVTFPENYGAKHLAGKEALFVCDIKSVNQPVPAEIDDELAKKFGAEDLAALKTEIAERLEAEYADAARAVLKRKLLDQLDQKVDFDLPEQLVEAESHQIAHQLWHEDHPEDAHNHDHGEIEPDEDHIKLAKRRVRLGLLLAEIGRKAEITVTDAEMTQAVVGAARQYPGQERAYFEFVQKNPQIQQQLRAPIFEDKVVDHILEQIRMDEKEVDKATLEKAVEALAEI